MFEVFLRTHQALAVLIVYAVWRHLPADKTFSKYCVYSLGGLFTILGIIEGTMVGYRNGIAGSKAGQAVLTHDYGVVKLQLRCPKPVAIDAGQYINIWAPSVSFWSFFQSHPFVVTSWAEEPQGQLDLFIEPRRGFTRQLLHHGKEGRTVHRPLLFSGPHGRSVEVDGYEKVLMVASGVGIASQLPYLKKILHHYNTRRSCVRRVHLIWQVENIGEPRH
jgi:predicted ferric reductase